MRLAEPRIAPLTDAEMDADQRELVAPMASTGRVLNIFRTLARAPKAAKGFLAWGNYILSRRNDLPAREREIVILRTGFLCKSGYEWTQHVEIGLRSGLTAEECERIKAGAEACQALYALRHKGPRRPDVAEAERRLSNVLSLLFNGEK